MRGKHFGIGGLAAALTLALAACGNGGAGTATGNGPTTLTVWLMTGSAPQSIVDAVNADFKAKHSNVTVKVATVPSIAWRSPPFTRLGATAV